MSLSQHRKMLPAWPNDSHEANITANVTSQDVATVNEDVNLCVVCNEIGMKFSFRYDKESTRGP